jgi:hypothetical protein
MDVGSREVDVAPALGLVSRYPMQLVREGTAVFYALPSARADDDP